MTHDYFILRNVAVATINMGVESPRRMAEFVKETVLSGNLRFIVVFNSYFYDFSMLRNVTMVILIVGVVSPPRITEYIKETVFSCNLNLSLVVIMTILYIGMLLW